MTGLEIWLLAIGLAMDCFAVSIASGIVLKRIQWQPILVMAIFFGLFQAIMPFLGWIGASSFSHLIESVDYSAILSPICIIGFVTLVLSMAGLLFGIKYGCGIAKKLRAELWGGIILTGNHRNKNINRTFIF